MTPGQNRALTFNEGLVRTVLIHQSPGRQLNNIFTVFLEFYRLHIANEENLRPENYKKYYFSNKNQGGGHQENFFANSSMEFT